MTPKPDNLPPPAEMDLPTLLRECARVLGNSGGEERGAGHSAELAARAMELAAAPHPGGQDIASAAATILRAGCSGVPSLAWLIDKSISGREPHYAPGDTSIDNKWLYAAVKQGLIELREEAKK